MAKTKKVENNKKAMVEKPAAKVTKKAVPASKPVVAKKAVPVPKPAVAKKAVPAPKPAVAKKAVPAPKPAVAKKAVPAPKPTVAKKAVPAPKPAVTKKAVPAPKTTVAKKVVPAPKPAVAKKVVPAPKPAVAKKAVPAPKQSVNRVASKEIKKAIKKAPVKKVAKNPALEAAKIAVLKPKIIKTADQMEQDMKKAAAKVETEIVEKANVQATSKETPKTPVKENKSSNKAVEKVSAPVKTDNKTAIVNTGSKKTAAVTPQSTTDEVANVNTTPVTYSDEELAMFEAVILEAKREALDELRMLKERLEDLNSYDLAEESMIYSMHMGEQGSEPMEKEKTYAQIQRNNEYIKKLDDALTRIKDKTYGICRVCGILIAKERLLAVPITTLSASWKIHQKCPEDKRDRIEAII
jgi:RNA polymerase-binding transcription factor DksA